MPRDAAIVGAAQRFGWSRVDSKFVQVALVAASAAVVVEAAHYFHRWPESMIIGGLPVSPSLIPLMVAGVAAGGRTLGRARSAQSARTFWVLGIVALAVGAVSLSAGRSPAAIISLLLTGFVEEFMYRGAIPAVSAFALARSGVRARRAGAIGLTVGGLCFVALPGHVQQWHGIADVVPFVAFALLAALAVWRTGALLEVALLHAVVNTVNIGRFDGASDPAGALLLAALMGVLVIAYVPPSRATHLVIDLTGDEPVVDEESVNEEGSATIPTNLALAD